MGGPNTLYLDPLISLSKVWGNSIKAEKIQREYFTLLTRLLRAIKRSYKRVLNPGSSSRPEVLTDIPVVKHGLRLEKLGTNYGGWTIPVKYISPQWNCYCIGAGEDISFDCALIERFDCDVYVLDPTPRAVNHVMELVKRVKSGLTMPVNNNPDVLYTLPNEKLDHLRFYSYGVWSEDGIQRFYTPRNDSHVSHSILNLQHTERYFEAECRSLTSLMQEFGHTEIDLLKLDVEGAEYEILDSMLKNRIYPRLLCVEFDEGNMPLDENANLRIKNMIERLKKADFILINRDGWNTTFIHKTLF